MVKSSIVALALVGVVACVGLVQANSHHDLDLGHGIGGELHGHGDFGLGGSLEHDHHLGLGHNHGFGHDLENHGLHHGHQYGHGLSKHHGIGHKLGHIGKHGLGVVPKIAHGIHDIHKVGHGLHKVGHVGHKIGHGIHKGGHKLHGIGHKLGHKHGHHDDDLYETSARSLGPELKGGFRNQRGAAAALKLNNRLGNQQHLQGSQASQLGAGGRIVNEHDRDSHFNDNHLHKQGGRNKNREIVKESDNSFGSVDADGVNIGNRDHRLQGAEAGFIGAQGSQGSFDNRQNFDNEFGAGAAIGSDRSGFGELNL